jgi:hypothetical protein
MPIRVVHAEIAIEALVDETFPKLTAKERGKVIAALIKANPTLEGRRKVEAGSVINVPTVAGVKPRPQSGPEDSSDPVEDSREFVVRAVNEFGAHLARRHEEYQAQLKQQAETLKGSELKRALKDRPDAAELVPGIEGAIKARSTESAALRKDLDDAVKKLAKAIGSL